jgi:hypothetical protein
MSVRMRFFFGLASASSDFLFKQSKGPVLMRLEYESKRTRADGKPFSLVTDLQAMKHRNLCLAMLFE